jgi:hypothetical protein
MRFRQKSTPQKVADVLGTYIKAKAITKTVKAVGKRMPQMGKAPVIAGVGAAAAGGALAARKLRQGGGEGPEED